MKIKKSLLIDDAKAIEAVGQLKIAHEKYSNLNMEMIQRQKAEMAALYEEHSKAVGDLFHQVCLRSGLTNEDMENTTWSIDVDYFREHGMAFLRQLENGPEEEGNSFAALLAGINMDGHTPN